MKRVACLVIVFLMLPFFSDGSSSDVLLTEGPYSLELTDESGNDLTDPLFADVKFHFDTHSDMCAVQYILKATVTLNIVPSLLTVVADDGLYNVRVSVVGLDSTYLADAGLRFFLKTGDDTYRADLEKSNQFDEIFRNDLGYTASFSPNQHYSLSIDTIDGVITDIAPETIHDITITFEATINEGYHQVMFVSENTVVDSYVVFDNETIDHVPSVSRRGYSLDGWYTLDGQEIVEGYVVSPDCGDIIAYAKWDEDGESNIMLIAGISAITLLFLLFLILLIKRRKESDDM